MIERIRKPSSEWSQSDVSKINQWGAPFGIAGAKFIIPTPRCGVPYWEKFIIRNSDVMNEVPYKSSHGHDLKT